MEARRLALQLTFVSRNVTLFTGVDWYWITTGIMTAVKPGVVTLEENWRFTPLVTASAVVSQANQGALPQVFVFRSLLTRNLTASAVVAALEQQPFVVGMYLIVSTAGDGVVITRSSMGYNSSRLSAATTPYLVQTNYDRWMPDPSSDPRRTFVSSESRGWNSKMSGAKLEQHGTL